MIANIRKFGRFVLALSVAFVLGTMLSVPANMLAQVLNTKSAGGWTGIALRGGTNPFVAAPAYPQIVPLHGHHHRYHN